MTEFEMLKRLIKNNFWYNEGKKGLEWSFREGITLADQDPELNTALLQWINNNNIKGYL